MNFIENIVKAPSNTIKEYHEDYEKSISNPDAFWKEKAESLFWIKKFSKVKEIDIDTIDIPPTQQIDNTPPPARPSIPVPSDDEDIADDLTLDELDFDDPAAGNFGLEPGVRGV